MLYPLSRNSAGGSTPPTSRGRASGAVHVKLSSACPTAGWDFRTWGRSAEPLKRSSVGCAALPRVATRGSPAPTPRAGTAARAAGASTRGRRPLRPPALHWSGEGLQCSGRFTPPRAQHDTKLSNQGDAEPCKEGRDAPQLFPAGKSPRPPAGTPEDRGPPQLRSPTAQTHTRLRFPTTVYIPTSPDLNFDLVLFTVGLSFQGDDLWRHVRRDQHHKPQAERVALREA